MGVIMRIRGALLAFVLWLALVPGASADVLVLVQGYLGSAGSWHQSGVTQVLAAAGWRDGGHLSTSPRGVIAQRPRFEAKRRYYTMDLPTEAPVDVQSRVLAQYIAYLRRKFPSEKIFLAGHSAGGVVARYYMVRAISGGAKTAISGLITIASPHLGTDAAETGLAAGQSPLGMIAPFFGGGTINRSQQLYSELVIERPGTMLGWLNRQKHPKSAYISIIRRSGDSEIVPEWSQNMNRVAALRGRSKVIFTPPGHELRADDGRLIAGILHDLRSDIRARLQLPRHIRAGA